jgi:hypothetical protein
MSSRHLKKKAESGSYYRVARFFLVNDTKGGKNVPNELRIYYMVIAHPKLPKNIPNVHKIYQHFPIEGPQKFIHIGIFCLKISHLATLLNTLRDEEPILRLLNLQLHTTSEL